MLLHISVRRDEIMKKFIIFQEWLKNEKERFDTDLDENKDGSLDENEVKIMLLSLRIIWNDENFVRK